ncbi:MAG: hypothetical protein HKN64_01450 [Woeseiaceae bacterium]|nr:hypothetical protein [Woeseiaceae bacterium]
MRDVAENRDFSDDRYRPLGNRGQAAGWVAAGASLVGGCCRMGAAHIRAMARQLEEHCM